MRESDFDASEVAAKQKTEIDFWRNDPRESPESNNIYNIYNIVNKVSDAAVFLECLESIKGELSNPAKIFELGSGQGWASCLVKRLFPQAHVTSTDLSEYAIKSLNKWEYIWQVKIDASYHCTSYETRESDSSLDLVFCFAAAHHFLFHDKTLHEIYRILKPGGKALYFYEPTSPKLFYSFAYQRVNRKRPHVPEDVLVISHMREIAHANNLKLRVDLFPSTLRREPLENVYYTLLSKFPLLCRLLP